jgi:hypothetical protein
VSYTGLTDIGAFGGSSQVLPAGTGMTVGAHQPEWCRSVMLDLVFWYVLQSVKVVVGL